MALTFELSEPSALALGCSLVDFSINSGPKLALTVHKVGAIWQDATDTTCGRHMECACYFIGGFKDVRVTKSVLAYWSLRIISFAF